MQPADRCLDVCCGTSTLVRFLLPELLNEGELLGVDTDPNLLVHAQETTAGVDVPVGFELAEALGLPFDNDAFDVVASNGILCILPNPLLALEEMVRVCRPGGTVASITCSCNPGTYPGLPA